MLRYITESLSEADLPGILPADNASVTQREMSARSLRLVSYNDISHLDGVSGPGPSAQSAGIATGGVPAHE
jgi:hypothetical protein